METNLTITLERTKNDEDRHDPSLASSSSSGQCHCADKPEETEEFHRFIILPKIPCGRKKQIDILKVERRIVSCSELTRFFYCRER